MLSQRETVVSERTSEAQEKQDSAPTLAGTEARFHRFRVGDIECVSLSDGAIRVPMRPPEPGKPMQFRLVPLACLLVTLPQTGKLVLMDSGFGYNPERLGKPLLSDGRLAESLSLAGISPEAIDDVLISHLDPDHIDGLFRDDGSKTFPRATYHVAAEEIAFWHRDPVDLSDSNISEAAKQDRRQASGRFLRLAGSTLTTFRAGEEVMPGVSTIALPGHTRGQVGFIVQGASETLLYTGDGFTNAVVSVETPHVHHPLDFYPEQGVQTRRKLIELLLENKWQSFSPHFPWPAIGRLERDGDRAIWKAAS